MILEIKANRTIRFITYYYDTLNKKQIERLDYNLLQWFNSIKQIERLDLLLITMIL